MAEADRARRSIWDVAFASLLPLHLFALLDLSVIEPHDFWWHVRTGQITAETGSIPTTDSFSFVTSGTRFVNEPWLAQVTLFELFAHAGLAAVILVHALTISTGYALVWRMAKRRDDGASARTANVALASIIAAAVGAAHWGVRPQSFSLLLFGALVAAMTSHARGNVKALYWAIPIFALWTNLHGGFAFGLLALGLHCATQIRAFYKSAARPALVHTVGAGLAAVLACGLNPHGFGGIYEHVAMFFRAGGSGIAGNSEFVPLSIKTADGFVFFFAVARFGVACVRGAFRPTIGQSISLAVFGVLTLISVRFEPYFGLLLLVPLASAMEAEEDRAQKKTSAASTPLRIAAVIASIAFAMATLPFWRASLPLPASRRGLTSAETPVAATRALCDALPANDRVLADQGFASYLIFACPRAKVFLDTRIQLFDARTWDEYSAVTSGRFDFEAILDAHEIDRVMLRTDQTDASRALRASGLWTKSSSDDVAEVWARVTPRSAP